MAVSPAREAAYRILLRVQSGRGFAVDFLQSRRVSALREVDRRLTTELVMGALRWLGELDFQLEQLSGKSLKYFDPEVATILRLGIYQIRFLAKVPKSAVVDEAVELTKVAGKRSAAGLVNAVLRKCQPPSWLLGGSSFGELTEEAQESVLRSFPSWLSERWKQPYGFEAMGALAWASNAVPPTVLRVVGNRSRTQEFMVELEREGVRTRPGRYSGQSLVVESGNVQSTGAWREGRVVIQDEASQLVATLLAPRPHERVLDLCAAPGSKTGQLATLLGQGMLVACDLSARRLRTMTNLLCRQVGGEVQVRFVRLDATQNLPFGTEFDRILLDVPCSGTGTLARNPEIKWRLRAGDVSRLSVVQATMLRNSLRALAPGGRLVYATCSLEPEENEQVVEKVLRESPGYHSLGAAELAREFPELSLLFDSNGYFRTRPDVHSMDGFFAAVITRDS